MTKPPYSKLSSLLEKFNKDFTGAFQKVLQNQWDYKHYEQFLAESKKETKAQIIELFNEVVGEDFKNWGELETKEQYIKSAENDLRAEMRKRLRELE